MWSHGPVLRSLLTGFRQPRQLRFAEHMEVKTNLEMDAARERFGSLLDQFSVSLLVQFAIIGQYEAG